MAVFEYRGILVDSGKAVKGYRDADNPEALRALLRRDGILLTLAQQESAEHAKKAGRDIDLLAYFKRPKIADVAVMTRQLAPPLRAGAVVSEQKKKAPARGGRGAGRGPRGGTSSAKGLEVHPKVFPPLFVNMIAAG